MRKLFINTTTEETNTSGELIDPNSYTTEGEFTGVGNTISKTASLVPATLSQPILEAGKTYILSIEIVSITAGSLEFGALDNVIKYTQAGIYTIQTAINVPTLLLLTATASCVANVIISVKEIL